MTPAITLGSAFAKDSGLGPVDRLVLNILDRTDRRWKASLVATRTIAEKIGRSVRTVQLALKRLKEAGYIAVELARKTEKGKPLNSGHRIHLLWRGGWYGGNEARNALGDERDDDHDFGATDCAGRAQPITPSEPAPSSIEIPEGDNPKEADDRPAETSGSSSSGEVSHSCPEARIEEPPAEAAPIVAKAAEVLGSDEATPGRIVAAIREHGAEQVAIAVDIHETKQRQTGERFGYGFFRRILANRKAEAYPPFRRPPTAAERAAEKSRAEGDKIRARRAKLREVFGPRPA